MNLTEELEKLHQLHRSGAISDEEYAAAKAKLLERERQQTVDAGGSPASTAEVKQWAMFLHLSQLLGLVIPLAGLIAPILIWQIKKQEMPELDVHGRVVANWILSALIYCVAAFVLSFLLIGIPLLLALLVVGVVFPIVGGIKASDGKLWRYPLSIPFFN